MNGVFGRKIIDTNGEEIIELNLNRPWPKKTYQKYSFEMERTIIGIRQNKKSEKDFIKILN